MTYPDGLIIDLLSQEQQRFYLADPDRLQQVVVGHSATNTFIIDEIQRVPDLLSVVHSLIEHYPEKQFILTGSSARKLKRSGVDLLGGRAILKTCHPFMAAELGGAFDLEDAIRFGLVPLVCSSKDKKATLDAYMGLYLREEVQAEGLVRNIGAFARFLEAISLSHGGVLNLSEVARECEVSRKAVEGYVQILTDLLVGVEIPVFSRRAKRQLIKHSKFYYPKKSS
jgi:predicted AAA+ superfamily ATPase